MSSVTGELLAIIPFYKRPEQLERCLAALGQSTYPVTPWVHDNSSENLGFTKAINLGLRAALEQDSPYALLLNQDCYIEPDAIGAFVSLMEAHPRCAVAGPMQLSTAEPDLIVNAGGLRAYPNGVCRGGRRSAGDFARSEAVPWVNGACMFTRLAAVREFGLMDESMFLIGSDSDWCFTARSRGWDVMYCAEARVLHDPGVTRTLPPLDVLRIMHQDTDHWRRKWLGSVLYHELDRSLDAPPLDVPVPQAMQKALQDHQAGRLLEAEVTYRAVLEIEPRHLDALHLLGVIALQNRLWVIALDLFRRAIAVDSDFPDLHMRCAQALACLNMKEEARLEYLEAARQNSDSAEPLEAMAEELEKLGFPADAAIAREKAQLLHRRT